MAKKFISQTPIYVPHLIWGFNLNIDLNAILWWDFDSIRRRTNLKNQCGYRNHLDMEDIDIEDHLAILLLIVLYLLLSIPPVAYSSRSYFI